MKFDPDIFYAKILLFGEYSVIYNSNGLTIPYTRFRGELSFINEEEDKYTDIDYASSSNYQLREYLYFISKLQKDNLLKCNFQVNEFEDDLKKGLYFESSIPQGYGLGSSGALCAALYNKYIYDKIKPDRNISFDDIKKLRGIFSQLESYYHGTSSGLDPLNAYIRYPLYIINSSEIKAVGIPRNKSKGDSAIFLINSGKAVKTEPLVKLFLEKCKTKFYKEKIFNELIPVNNSCINTLITGKVNDFFMNIKKLSKFQLRHFNEMIPVMFQGVWQKGLETGDYYIKLCGSGGGGYLLGFTEKYEKVKTFLKNDNIEFITVYRNTQS